jgi:diguanylate cyclase (GGDEF)-like protein
MKRTISFQPYILAIALFVVVFIISSFFLIRSIETFFFQSVETQYTNYASIYSQGLTKTAEAYRIINDMLERRIVSAIRTIALYSDQINNETILDVADTLAVDDIYLYNLDGEIEFSTREVYLGWKATPGHPVHAFLTSGLTSFIEEIRQDTESDEYHKYGYYRLEDGRLIQVGINAALVQGFLAPFEIERLLKDMVGFVDHVYFVEPGPTVSACCDPSVFGFHLGNPEIMEALASRSIYSLRRHVEGQNREIYEIFIPIFVGDDYEGTLVVAKTTDEADTLAHTAMILSIIIGAVVFSSIIYIMISNYRHNKRLATLAYEDALTGLPNKAHLEQMLDHIRVRPFQDKRAILMIHGRSISAINSTYGLDVGDRVIKEVAKRLEAFVAEGSQLFRFADDRFVVFADNYRSKEELRSLAERILAALEPPVSIVGRPIEICIGVVESEPGLGAMEALSQASMVIHHLEQGHGDIKYAFFDARIEEKLRREEIIALEMQEFLDQPHLGTFHLEYQPKVDLASNSIVGFEALSRMTSPTLGRVSPPEFISIAERQEMIIPFGYWVLEAACQFIKRIGQQGHSQLYVAVNISVAQLLQKDFLRKVGEIVAKAGIDPHNLQLEITESVLIEDFDEIRAKLQPLQDLGLTIALDDFGTGYSALSRMGELPVDVIKIDKSFIDKILVQDNQRQIIQELIAMCHKLGLIVVAEGVEHEEQRQYLLEAGCDLMQGYLYSKPVIEELALQKLRSDPLRTDERT